MTLVLPGAVALVTGGASGIGAGTARMLAAAGARVVVADIDLVGARAVAHEVGGLAVRCDVGVLADNTAAVTATLERFGRLDVVVLNAGIASGMAADEFDEAAYRRIVGVNLDGVVMGLAAVLPALRAGSGGRVVAVASLAGLAPVPEDPVYAATKAAVVNYVRSVGPALAGEGILVNAVCPGFADTAIVDALRPVLSAVGWPLMTVDEVVAAIAAALGSSSAGEAWLVQHGRPAQPYRFGGIPAPVRDASQAAGPDVPSSPGR